MRAPAVLDRTASAGLPYSIFMKNAVDAVRCAHPQPTVPLRCHAFHFRTHDDAKASLPSAFCETSPSQRKSFARRGSMDGDRPRCTLFEVLPSAQEYPDYYQLIKAPIDLTSIESNIASKYRTPHDHKLSKPKKPRSREIEKRHLKNSPKHPQSILSLNNGGCAGRREVGAVPSRHAAALHQRQALQRRRLQRLQRCRGIGGGVQGAALAQARLVLRERLPADGGCQLRRVQRGAPRAYVRPGLPNLSHRQEAGRGKHNIEAPPQLFRCGS